MGGALKKCAIAFGWNPGGTDGSSCRGGEKDTRGRWDVKGGIAQYDGSSVASSC